MPILAVTKGSRFRQHALAAVNAENLPRGTHRFDQRAKVSTCPTTDIKNSVPGAELQSLHRFGSNTCGEPEYNVEKRIEGSQVFVAAAYNSELVIKTHSLSPQRRMV